jgi:hypothetical protein
MTSLFMKYAVVFLVVSYQIIFSYLFDIYRLGNMRGWA